MKKLVVLLLTIATSFSYLSITSNAAMVDVVVEGFQTENYGKLYYPAFIEDHNLVIISNGLMSTNAKYKIDLEPNTEYTVVWELLENSFDKGQFVAIKAEGFIEGEDVSFPHKQTGRIKMKIKTLPEITSPYIWSYAKNDSQLQDYHIKGHFTVYKEMDMDQLIAKHEAAEASSKTTAATIVESDYTPVTAVDVSTEVDTAVERDVTTLGVLNDGSDITDVLNALPQGDYYFPAGEYGIDGGRNGTYAGFAPRSNSTYRFDENAVLKILDESDPYSSGIYIRNANDLTIINAHIVGNSNNNQWCHGIIISEGNGKVVIDGAKITNVASDGITIKSTEGSEIIIQNFAISNTKRTGIAIENSDSLIINNGTITNVSGGSPSAGIMISPWHDYQRMNNVIIEKVTTKETKVGVLFANLHNAGNYNITVNRSTIDGIFVQNIEGKSDGNQGLVSVNETTINGKNLGLTWINSYGKFQMINPTFDLDLATYTSTKGGIFRIYQTSKSKVDAIGGLTVTGARILNEQRENEDMHVFRFNNKSDSIIKDMYLEIVETNITNTLWTQYPKTLKNIYLETPKIVDLTKYL